MTDILDAALKSSDLDRWLATRFVAELEARADLVALYVFDAELSAISRRVSEPLAAEIRLTWWRDRVEAAARGERVGEAPALAALQPALVAGRISTSLILSALDARFSELHRPWFEDEADLDAYLDAVGADLGEAAVRRLDPQADVAAARSGFRAYVLDRLMRTVDADLWTPASWSEVSPSEQAEHLRHKLADDLATAARPPALSDKAFPALAHVTLAKRNRHGALADRLRVLLAVARGRI